MCYQLKFMKQKVHNRAVIIQSSFTNNGCLVQFDLCDLLVEFAFVFAVFVHSAVSHSVYHAAFGHIKTLLGQDCKKGYCRLFSLVSEYDNM